jgi:hypothetical protein
MVRVLFYVAATDVIQAGLSGLLKTRCVRRCTYSANFAVPQFQILTGRNRINQLKAANIPEKGGIESL